MADIRIKDLTTTASSTASGDFFVIDGTTGTRKVNAFSPTFGGNATVTGTLTGNSTITAAGNIKSSLSSSGATAGILIAENSAAAATGNQASVFLPTSTGASTYWQLNARQNSATLNDQTLRVVFGGVAQHTYFNASDLSVQSGITLKVLDTTASTTTSTGALVVGNGTSGGLGVGGAIYAGGAINSDSNVIAARATIGRGDVGSPGAIGLVSLLDVSGGIGRLQVYNFTTSTVGALNIQSNGGALGIGSTSTVTTINGTTASTSTSSGALVVSGGVGVAGAIYGGGDIISSGNGNIQGGRFTSVNSNSYIEQSGTDFTYVTGGSRPHVFSIGGTTRFQVTTSGIISSLPASAASLTVNSTMTFELTSNTSLKIFVRGSDGTTRSTTLTLA